MPGTNSSIFFGSSESIRGPYTQKSAMVSSCTVHRLARSSASNRHSKKRRFVRTRMLPRRHESFHTAWHPSHPNASARRVCNVVSHTYGASFSLNKAPPPPTPLPVVASLLHRLCDSRLVSQDLHRFCDNHSFGLKLVPIDVVPVAPDKTKSELGYRIPLQGDASSSSDGSLFTPEDVAHFRDSFERLYLRE